MARILPTVLRAAHQVVASALRPGDLAVDATAGNGHDTLWLARCVGPTGLVIALDVQPAALEATRRRLEPTGCSDRVRLVLQGHEQLDQLLEPLAPRSPRAIMFNLGFLPGGSPDASTRAETTLPALESALRHLAPGGVLTVTLYPGHPEGLRETQAVLAWARALHPRRPPGPPPRARVLWYRFLHSEDEGPSLLVLEPVSRPDPTSRPDSHAWERNS